MIWEYYEWVIEQTMPAKVHVGYTDTIVDLAAGMAGSIVAGLCSSSRGAAASPAGGEPRHEAWHA